MEKIFPLSIEALPFATWGRRESSRELHQKWDEQSARVRRLKARPRIKLFIPLEAASSPVFLEHLLDSLQAQSYPYWIACFLPAKGTEPLFSRITSRNDERFSFGESTDADWVGFLRPQTTLSPVALFSFVTEGLRQPAGTYLTAHEIWSPKKPAFLSRGPLHPFNLAHGEPLPNSVIRTTREFPWGPGVASRNDWLQFLKANESAHLPLFLIYRAEPVPVNTHVSLVEHSPPASLSVIICFRNRSDDTIRCVKSLSRNASEISIEWILVDNDSKPEERHRIESALEEFPIRYLNAPGPFNYAAMQNQAIDAASHDTVFLLNNDVAWQKGDLAKLVALAKEEWVGTVGIRLIYPDGRTQHGGMKAQIGGLTRSYRMQLVQDEDAVAKRTRTVYANSFAACLFKKALWKDFGLDEIDLANGFGDVEFNFECIRRGLKNIYSADTVAIHRESASRGSPYEFWEENKLQIRYSGVLEEMIRFDAGWNRVSAGQPLSTQIRQLLQEMASLALRRFVPGLKNKILALKMIWASIFRKGQRYDELLHRKAKLQPE